MRRGRKKNLVLSFTLRALSPTFFWTLSSSVFVQHSLLSYPSLGILYCPSPHFFTLFSLPRGEWDSSEGENIYSWSLWLMQTEMRIALKMRLFLWKMKTKRTFSHIMGIFQRVLSFVAWTKARFFALWLLKCFDQNLPTSNLFFSILQLRGKKKRLFKRMFPTQLSPLPALLGSKNTFSTCTDSIKSFCFRSRNAIMLKKESRTRWFNVSLVAVCTLFISL